MFPFTNMPTGTIIGMLYVSVSWSNNFRPTERVLDMVIPQIMIKVTEAKYKRHCHTELGKCVQTHEEHDS